MFFFPLLFLVSSSSTAIETPIEKELSRLQIPEKLVPKGKQPLFLLRAEGVQIYEAKSKGDKLAWVLKTPRADLLDYKTGEKVGTHTEGPVWEDEDGKVTGKKLADSPSPNADAIDWLLVEGKPSGKGRLAKVTHIQRVDTWAGRAPTTPPTKLGEIRESRYQATYVFWGER